MPLTRVTREVAVVATDVAEIVAAEEVAAVADEGQEDPATVVVALQLWIPSNAEG